MMRGGTSANLRNRLRTRRHAAALPQKENSMSVWNTELQDVRCLAGQWALDESVIKRKAGGRAP